MSVATVVIQAIERAIPYLPYVALIPVAQVLHELTHFAVARYYDTDPVLVLRLRSVMLCVYDDRGLSVPQETAIGLAPTLTGLTALTIVLFSGWLSGGVTPVGVLLAVAWTLYTLPSPSDSAPAREWLGPDEPIAEPQRSLLIGGLTFASGAWAGVLPLPYRYSFVLTHALIFSSMVYMGLAVWEHRDKIDVEDGGGLSVE